MMIDCKEGYYVNGETSLVNCKLEEETDMDCDQRGQSSKEIVLKSKIEKENDRMTWLLKEEG